MAEVFDKDGKYVRTDWETGDRITASKLNKIELSIEAVNDNDIARHIEADSRLDALESGLTETNTKLNNVETAYKAADTSLTNKINSVESAYKAADGAMTTRVDGIETAYKAADATINSKIDNMDTAYKAADASLQNSINSVNTTLTNKTNTIDAAYKAADSAMTTRVDGIDAAYKAADGAMTTRVDGIETAYKAADTTLQNNINSTSTTLTNRINTVETAYKAADTAIQNAIPTKVSQLTNDSNYADKAYVDNAVDSVDVTSQLSDYAKKSDLSSYATTSFVTSQLNNLTTGSNVPTYVITEAQMVADKVIEKRNAYSLVIGAMSDLHTTGSDTSATGVLHAFQGINEIDKLTPVDLVAIHGDVIVLKMDDTYKDGLRYVRTCMNEVTKNIPLIHMQGNHDELNTDTTEEARQKYFRYIGANNVDVTTDFGNRFRNYGYKDFDDLRIRFIYLNSADLSDFEQTGDLWITPMQYNWFINKALDFSDKEGSEDWQWIVACHHPLNWGTPVSNLQLILKAYTKKTTGSFTFTDPVEGDSTISYDFTNAKQKLICHIHGHIHNFRTEWFDDVLSVTVPNACFGRNNEYGTAYGDESWAQITGGDADENGVQRQFNKTSNTANDTAFVTLVIDSRVNNKIYAYCYGAGIDREIDLVSKEVTYISKEEDIEIPSEVLQYTNLVPTSIETDGSIYNNTGYKDNAYISTSDGLPGDSNGFVTTGYMELPNTFYVYGATMDVADSYCRIATYDSSFTMKTILPATSYANYFTVTDMGNGIQKIEITNSAFGTYDYIRLSLKGTGENLYIYSMDENTSQDNLLPKAIDTDGSIYNEVGFKIGWRLSGTTGLEKEDASFTLTGYIPFTCGDVIRMANILIAGTQSYVWTYDSEFNPVSVVDISELPCEVGDTSVTWSTIDQEDLHANAKYIRISIQGAISSNTIITINEEITEGIITPTPAPELFTNLVPTSIDTDGNIYNGTGYKADYRGNSSGTETALDGAIVSGFIPYNNEVIQVYGSINSNHSAVGYYINFYDESFSQLTVFAGGNGTLEEVEGYYLWTLDPGSTTESQQTTISQAKYIRASMPNCEPGNFAVGLS